jgi:hypothetical protein
VSGVTPRDVLFDIKEAMVNFDQNPWTVVGSCDGVTFAMDAVDRWVNSADILYRTTSGAPMSWIVLQQASVAGTFQVILYVNDTVAIDPNRENVNMLANIGGFGVAVGGSGTDGAVNSIPIAGDPTKSIGLDGTDWQGAEAAANTQKVITCISSTDGECLRVVVSQQSTGVPIMVWGVEVPRLPRVGWVDPVVMYMLKSTISSGLSCIRWESMQEAEPFRANSVDFNSDPLAASLRMIGPMLATTEIVDYEQDLGNPRLYGGNLIFDGIAADWDWGTLFDWYWCNRNVSGAHLLDLDTIPLAGNRTFVCVGDCIWGWLDDSATDLSYT